VRDPPGVWCGGGGGDRRGGQSDRSPGGPPRRGGRSGAAPSAAAPPRRRLPLPGVPALRSTATGYGLAAVDCRGRIADRVVLRALGWAPATGLDIREAHGLLVITVDRRGGFRVTGQGHLRLPAAVRRWCGLVAGDRVLLAADLTEGALVVHPPAVLDAMITRFWADARGGAPA
jgi:hypothetical protein